MTTTNITPMTGQELLDELYRVGRCPSVADMEFRAEVRGQRPEVGRRVKELFDKHETVYTEA